MIYKAQKNWDFAEDSFVRAIELNINPNDSLFADANYYLSQSLAKNGELNDEIARMEEQFKTDIAYTNDLLQLATHYLWAGKPNLAKQQLDTLKTRDENLARQLERLIKLHQRG
jgi:tetratricopeptide (TPR) repeat protein